MPVVQLYSSGSSASVLDQIDAVSKNSVAFSSPLLVRTNGGPKPGRKKLVRRDDHEYSQALRLGVQVLFVALNLWIGIQFYLWVRWAESEARALVETVDRERAAFIKKYFHVKWPNRWLYHAMLNTAAGDEMVIRAILSFHNNATSGQLALPAHDK